MLRAILNKSWRQHPTRHQLYGHLPPIMKTIQVRRARHAGHCWRSKDELVSDVLLWTLTYGQAKAGGPAWTYIQQLCEDTGCNPEDLLEAMNDKEKWRERVRDIRAGGTTWWWWWWLGCYCPANYDDSPFHRVNYEASGFYVKNLLFNRISSTLLNWQLFLCKIFPFREKLPLEVEASEMVLKSGFNLLCTYNAKQNPDFISIFTARYKSKIPIYYK